MEVPTLCVLIWLEDENMCSPVPSPASPPSPAAAPAPSYHEGCACCRAESAEGGGPVSAPSDLPPPTALGEGVQPPPVPAGSDVPPALPSNAPFGTESAFGAPTVAAAVGPRAMAERATQLVTPLGVRTVGAIPIEAPGVEASARAVGLPAALVAAYAARGMAVPTAQTIAAAAAHGSTPVPTAGTPGPSNSSGGVQQGLALRDATGSDAQILAGVTAKMGASPTASAVLAKLSAGRAQIKLVSATELQAVSPSAQAFFNNADNTIYLPRDLAASNPTAVAIMLAHEGTHWIHDPVVDTEKQAVRAALDAGDNARGQQLLLAASLATEVEAYMVEARAGGELGMRPPGQHPALRADGSFATHEETWRALAADKAYNPAGLSGTPRWHTMVLPSATG